METSLHRQLKLNYADTPDAVEVVVDGFRIDAISAAGELVEIQVASLGALRKKTMRLVDGTEHALRIVKPIVARKRVTTITRKGGRTKRTRMSPLRGELVELFQELVHFSTVFPRERLTLEFVLIETEEIRVDRKQPSRRRKKYSLVDQKLVQIVSSVEFRTTDDLLAQLPLDRIPSPFDTAELAAALERPRWFAQKVAYCLRTTGAVRIAGKRGNSLLYQVNTQVSKAA